MKTQSFLWLLLLFLPQLARSQTVADRVQVNGIIMSGDNDVEAVSVFNKSSNTGTITNEKGAFTIKVTTNDIIELSALQFQVVSIVIDEAMVKSKQLKIHLVEQINQLEAVTLTAGLTGNLETDISHVKIVKVTPIDLGNMNAFNMDIDRAFDKSVVQNHLKSIINPNARQYKPNLIKILKLLKKSKKNSASNVKSQETSKHTKPKNILDVYSHKTISDAFEIPQEQVEAFLAYIESQDIDATLFETENELQLIELLIDKKKLFFDNKQAKD